MAALPQRIEVPCCSPATTESVAVVRDKIGDTRSDVLVGQGNIMRTAGDYTMGINANIDRSILASMSQTDKYGLANLNSNASTSDNVTRSGYAGIEATHNNSDKLGLQASTIAWNQAGIQNAGFAEARGQLERVNDAQSAYSDRSFKNIASTLGDSFSRLSAQGENGFYRTGAAVGEVDKQVVQSEMSLGRAVNVGVTDLGNNMRDTYARLSEQNCTTKEAIAAYGNRASDQTASVLATLSAQHTTISRDLRDVGKELALQGANHYGSLQLEASKNTANIQLQAAVNSKDNLLEQSKWFALAEKTAMINKCELEAKLAACCCEIKESVTGTANATQALIQANESSRVREALNIAATENAILKLRREEHHHYPHYYRGEDRRGSGGGGRD